MHDVAVYLQALRDGQHLSRNKLADLVDTTDNTIGRIERGRQEPGAR